MCKECSLENLLETWMGTALVISFAKLEKCLGICGGRLIIKK
jgi:RNA polymerase subunit RPABC4/transcription elongation factor Spt4